MQDLIHIVALLRSPQGCPWDKEQTHSSIKMNLIEEAYETAEAIEQNNAEHLCEELGDLLLQIALHAQIETENNVFNFDTVCDGICKKLIYRHPHVFANTEAQTSAEVLQNWEGLKRAEKGRETLETDIADVPLNFPALIRATKVQKRAGNHGLKYEDIKQALADLKSEICELEEALEQGDTQNTESELGDVLFSTVNVARILKIDAEQALMQSTQRFAKRIIAYANKAQALGGITALTKVQQDKLWQDIKMGFMA